MQQHSSKSTLEWQNIALPESAPIFDIDADFGIQGDALGKAALDVWMNMKPLMHDAITAGLRFATNRARLIYSLVLPHVMAETLPLTLVAMFALTRIPSISAVASAFLWVGAHILQLRLAAYTHLSLSRRLARVRPSRLPHTARRRDRVSEAQSTPQDSGRDTFVETLRQLLLPACLLLSLRCHVPGAGLVLMALGMHVDAAGGGLVSHDFVRHVRRSVRRVRFADPLESDGVSPPQSPVATATDGSVQCVARCAEVGWDAGSAGRRSVMVRLVIYATAVYGARCIITAV